MKTITRAEMKLMLDSGRKLVWATLNERKDYLVELAPGLVRVVRDVTNEPNHHTRSLIGQK